MDCLSYFHGLTLIFLGLGLSISKDPLTPLQTYYHGNLKEILRGLNMSIILLILLKIFFVGAYSWLGEKHALRKLAILNPALALGFRAKCVPLKS